MLRSGTNLTLRRKLTTQGYRRKTPQYQGVMLLEEFNITKTEAAEAVRLTSQSMNRALRAKEEGRDLGRNGKPPIFNQDDVDKLLMRLYDLRDITLLTMKILREQVIITI